MTATPTREDAGILVTLRAAPVAARALLAGIFVNKLGAFIQVFLVLFLTGRGFGAVAAGVALGLYGAGSVLGVLAGGMLSDRLGPRTTILASMAGTAVLVLSVLYLRDYPALLVVVTVVGAVSQLYRPASAALLSELTPAHRQVMIFAMYRLALNLGTTAAPLLGAALIAVSWDLLFWGEAVAALGYAAIAFVALPRRAAPEPATAGGEAPDAATATAAAAPEPAAGGYRAVLADRRYLLFLAAMLVNAAVYVQYLSTLPLAVRAAGLAMVWYSVMVALNGFIVITCELLVTRVVQHWPARIVVLVGFTLLGGGLACYALPLGVAAFLVGTLIWSLAEIVGGPTMFAYPATAGPARLRGRYIGSAHAMFGLGSAVGPVAGVWAWDAIGRSVWVACGLVALLGLAAAWVGIRPRPVGGSAPDGATGAPGEPAAPPEPAGEPVAVAPSAGDLPVAAAELSTVDERR